MTERGSRLTAAWAALTLAVAAGWILRAPGEWVAALGRLARDLVAPGGALPENAWYAARAAAVALGVVLASDAVGMRLARWWLGRRPAGVVRCVLPLAGHAMLSTALLGLAALGVWTPAVLIAVAASASVWCGPEVLACAGDWRRGARAAWGALPRALRGPAIAAIALGAVVTLPPETGIDALAYHLALPSQWLVTHRLIGSDGYSHWMIPLPLELPHVWALLAGVDTAAVWTGGAMLMAGAMASARALGAGALAPWLAAAAVLVSGQRWMLLSAKNDGHAAGLLLAAGACLVAGGALRRAALRGATIAGAGALLGLTVMAKYVLVPFAAGLGAAAVWRCRPAHRAALIVLLGGFAAVATVSWLGKGWVVPGDPFYPMGSAFFPRVFGGPGSAEIRRALLDQHVRDPAHGVVAPAMVVRLVATDLLPALAGAGWIRAMLPPGGAVLGLAGFVASVAAPFLLRGDFATVERYAFPVLVLANLAGLVAVVRAGRRIAVTALAACALAGAIALPADDRDGRAGAFAAGAVNATAYRAATVSPRAGLAAALAALPPDRRGTILAVGELALDRLPRRTRMQVFEPPLAWSASRDAADWRRVGIRFRQSDVRWILYNQPLARLDAVQRRPYAWSPEQLRRYADWCARHVRVGAFCGVAVPGWGSAWLLEVADRPQPPAARFPFLPGAEAAFASPVLADENDNPRWAAEWWKGWRGVLPEVAWLDARLGGSLLRAGRAREAFPYLRRAAADGVVDEANLCDLAVAAARTGRPAEARAALAAARRVLTERPGRLAEAAREIMGAP